MQSTLHQQSGMQLMAGHRLEAWALGHAAAGAPDCRMDRAEWEER